ncbi:MAG: hypothetical protein ACE5FG_12750 [Myxococcota bacterium]
MISDAPHAGADVHGGRNPTLELRVGRETVRIWFDSRGIHFRHPEGRRTEGVLPWDVALAMSLLPEREGAASEHAPVLVEGDSRVVVHATRRALRAATPPGRMGVDPGRAPGTRR